MRRISKFVLPAKQSLISALHDEQVLTFQKYESELYLHHLSSYLKTPIIGARSISLHHENKQKILKKKLKSLWEIF